MSSRFNLMYASKKNVNETLDESRAGDALWKAALTDPVEDFLSRPGKRIRADLIEVAYRIAGGQQQPPKEIVDFIELLHAGSLIIDDIQDNSRNRRQQDAMHLKYGVPLALNTGNWMYFAALEKLAHFDFPSGSGESVMKKTLQVIRKCHEGQALDLAGRFDRVPPKVFLETVSKISQLKTGALTGLAAWLGGKAAAASESLCNQLHGFGMQLGIGLQMQNDFVELRQTAMTQAASDDLRNRRITWPWGWMAKSHSSAEVSRIVRLACRQTPEIVYVAQQILKNTESLAVDEINQQLRGSINSLPPADSQVTTKLKQIINALELQHV